MRHSIEKKSGNKANQREDEPQNSNGDDTTGGIASSTAGNEAPIPGNQLPAKVVGANFVSGKNSNVLFRTDFVEILLDRQHLVLFVRWLRPVDNSEYRHGILETGHFLQEHKLEKLLVNNYRLGMLTMDTQGWLVRTSIEVVSKHKLQQLAIVSSTDILQQLTNEALDSRVKEKTPYFETHYFLSEQDALEWLQLC